MDFINIVIGVIMGNLPLGTCNDLEDMQFYNNDVGYSFISDNLEMTKKGSTPVILLTGIKGAGKTTFLKRLKKDFQDSYLVVYMDLSAMDKFKNKKLNRFTFMKLLYGSIVKACRESNIVNIDEQILKYYKPHNLRAEEDYGKFATFVMDLPQQIYDSCKDSIDGVLIFMDEFQMLKQLDDDVNGFLWYIRSVIQSQKHVGYIFSGSMSVRDDLITDIQVKKAHLEEEY